METHFHILFYQENVWNAFQTSGFPMTGLSHSKSDQLTLESKKWWKYYIDLALKDILCAIWRFSFTFFSLHINQSMGETHSLQHMNCEVSIAQRKIQKIEDSHGITFGTDSISHAVSISFSFWFELIVTFLIKFFCKNSLVELESILLLSHHRGRKSFIIHHGILHSSQNKEPWWESEK